MPLHRPADTTRQLHTQDVEAIEATVRALEHKLRDIKAYVAREAAAIPQVEAVVAACQLQQHHLHHIAGHLPTYLPSLRSPEVAGVKENSRAAPNQAAAADGGGGGGPKKRPPAPRRYGRVVAGQGRPCLVPASTLHHATPPSLHPPRTLTLPPPLLPPPLWQWTQVHHRR